ncbi:MAG: hypothetical protein ABSF55_04240 [Candidatus Staskawiczbacteria bacterium]|jgi:hypothetical protein
MAKYRRDFAKEKGIKFFVFVVIILLVILAGFFVYSRFIKGNDYLIKNKYYGFELTTPKNWSAEENASYSEDNINQLLTECKSDGSSQSSVYEIGAFRFKDQKYPQDFGISGSFPAGFPSGAILEIAIDCIPGSIKSKVINYNYGNLKIGGEKAFDEFLNLPVFGKTEYLSFSHNNFQYKISEYVYVSPADKIKSEEKIRENYAKIFNEIISSFKFK